MDYLIRCTSGCCFQNVILSSWTSEIEVRHFDRKSIIQLLASVSNQEVSHVPDEIFDRVRLESAPLSVKSRRILRHLAISASLDANQSWNPMFAYMYGEFQVRSVSGAEHLLKIPERMERREFTKYTLLPNVTDPSAWRGSYRGSLSRHGAKIVKISRQKCGSNDTSSRYRWRISTSSLWLE